MHTDRSEKSRPYSPQSARMERLEDDLRRRLAIGWRNIYRTILKADSSRSGHIQCNQFASIVHNNQVFISREELLRICKRFGTQIETARTIGIESLEDFFGDK